MKKRIHLSLGIAVMLTVLVGCAGSRAFREAREEELLEHWDLAVLKYSGPWSSIRRKHYRIALARPA